MKRLRDIAARMAIGGLVPAVLALLSVSAAARGPEAAEPLQDLSAVKPNDLQLPVNEHLGSPLPMELEFTNEKGERKRLGDFFTHEGPDGKTVAGKPAIVALVYFRCPVICSTLLNTITECVRDIEGLDAGRDFSVLTFSFDPQDDKFSAARRKESLLEAYGRKDKPGVADAWQFYLHEEGSTRQLANALGFQYRKVERDGRVDFAHPVVFFLVTPEGKIARYVYGFGHSALQLRLSLLDAGSGTITPSLKDQFLTFCYMFDPKVGRYTLSAIRVMQAGGIVTMTGLAGLIGLLLIGERLRARRARAAGKGGSGAGGVGGAVGVGGVGGVGGEARPAAMNR